ncbi:class I adenylate-forming enzyme family protein [Streptomyces avermitilis]|uniref:class I adenylate-forming enzyme family protein n=1 Tax=Streptomyces avermitilis TaxID=33903 RepID=UPI0038059252
MTTSAPDTAQVEDFFDRVVDVHPPTSSHGADNSLPGIFDAMSRLPVAPGEIVMIALPNGMRLLRCYFAALSAGHVPVLLAPSTPDLRIEMTAERLGAAALIGSRPRFADRPDVAAVGLGGPVAEVFDGPRRRYDPGQAILLTSGTSGMATGCLHDVAALRRNARRHADSIGLTGADTVLASLPVYYSFALVAQVLAALETGASLVLSGPPFTAPGYAAAVAEHKVTCSSLTPLLAVSLTDAGGRLPDGLRTLTVGGQAMGPEETGRLLGANPSLKLYLTYGLTQAGPRVATLAAHREPFHRHSSAGLPMDGVTLSTRDVGRGPDMQELLVTSDTVYRARVGTEPGTPDTALLAADTVATGDLGHIDEDGYLFLRGRRSDFAIVRGEKVLLSSVREAVNSLPGVLRTTVVAPEPTGEALSFDIYLERDGASEKEMRRALSRLLAPHERPGRLTLHRAEAGSFHK